LSGNYYVRASASQTNTFSISITPDGPLLDFYNSGFALTNRSITGGEHFYSVVSTKSGINLDRHSISKISPGTVWSIRGYKRDILAEVQSISDDIKVFLEAIGAESIANSRAYYAGNIGRFLVSAYDSSNDRLTLNQLGNEGKGLGHVVLSTETNSASGHYLSPPNTESPPEGGWLYLADGFGWVWHHYDKPMFAKKVGDSLQWFYRWSLDSDILMLVKQQYDSAVDSIVIEGKPYQAKNVTTSEAAGLKIYSFIKFNGSAPTSAEYEKFWNENLVPDTTSAQVPEAPADPLTIDIDSFRNVGRKQYRVNSVSEEEYGRYSVKASEYNRDKFEIIEKSLSLNRPTFPIPPQVEMEIPTAPSDVNIKDITHRSL